MLIINLVDFWIEISSAKTHIGCQLDVSLYATRNKYLIHTFSWTKNYTPPYKCFRMLSLYAPTKP